MTDKIMAEPGKFITRSFEVEEVEFRDKDDRMTVIGHAAVFDRRSEDLGGFQEEIKRGAFRKVLDKNADVRLLINHDQNLVLARTQSGTLDLREDPKGLKVYAEIAPTTYAKDLRILMKRGDVNQMSFGFKVGTDSWTETDGEVLRSIHGIEELYDVSVVTFPAYPHTSATIRSHFRGQQLISPFGEVDIPAICDLMESIHQGSQEATQEERDLIDHLLIKTPHVSPWLREKAVRALPLEEPNTHAQSPGERLPAQDKATSGEPFRLAARRRRLRVLEQRT